MDARSTEEIGHILGGQSCTCNSNKKTSRNHNIGVGDLMPFFSSISPTTPMSNRKTSKADKIRQACEDRDLDSIRELAVSEDGLVEDELRRTACMTECFYS